MYFHLCFSSSKMSCIFVFRWVYHTFHCSLDVILSMYLYSTKSRPVPVIFRRRRKVFRQKLVSGCVVQETRTCTSRKCVLDQLLCVLTRHTANESRSTARQRTSPRKARYILSWNSGCCFWKFTVLAENSESKIHIFFEIYSCFWAYLEEMKMIEWLFN